MILGDSDINWFSALLLFGFAWAGHRQYKKKHNEKIGDSVARMAALAIGLIVLLVLVCAVMWWMEPGK